MTTRQNMPYDHSAFTVVMEEGRAAQIGATGVVPLAGFRSKLKAIVTSISAVVSSLATGTVILTLEFNGSVAAILTLTNSVNTLSTFTLTANRTLDTMADHFNVSTPTHATGQIYVIYQYHVVPQDVVTFGTNLI